MLGEAQVATTPLLSGQSRLPSHPGVRTPTLCLREMSFASHLLELAGGGAKARWVFLGLCPRHKIGHGALGLAHPGGVGAEAA